MAGSCPIVRERIKAGLLLRTGPACGETLTDLKREIGLKDVSVTQFDKALGSLAYKSYEVVWRRNVRVAGIGPVDASPGHVAFMRH